MSQTKIANKTSTILAFYPQPKALGFALMDSPNSIRLSGYRYISAKNISSYLKLIESLIKFHKPAFIILEEKKSRNRYRLKPMQSVFNELEKRISNINYPIIHYSRDDISNHFGGITKPEIAQAIAKVFPVYGDRLPRQRSSIDGAESPAICEFDSISLCMTHYKSS